MSESLQSKIIQAARDKHQIAGEVPLRVASIVQMAGTCFRNLKLTSGGSQYPYNISVYLSSDNRFLATGVLDLEEGVLQNGAKQATIFASLTVGRHVTYGPADAPTLVSIFGDFQYPHCKKFITRAEERIRTAACPGVKLAFRHAPSPIRSWAIKASQNAMCAALQSNEAYWPMHDLIFRHQDNLDDKNIGGALIQYASQIESLDKRAYQACLDDELTLGLVMRDSLLAASLAVHVRPTAFVNGTRIDPSGDFDALDKAVRIQTR